MLFRGNGGGPARLGLAVAKKHCRLASGRNRIKRIVRESFRRQQDTLGSIDVVVMNTPAAHKANNKALFASLEQHWQRCRAHRKTVAQTPKRRQE